MEALYAEYLQHKTGFEECMQQKKFKNYLSQFPNSTLQDKPNDQSIQINKGQQQEMKDLQYQMKTIEYIQRIESRQRGYDKMIQIEQNQVLFLNAIQLRISKNQKEYHKISQKNNKTNLCRACPEQKYFANKYTLKRHILTKHNTGDKQKINIDSKKII